MTGVAQALFLVLGVWFDKAPQIKAYSRDVRRLRHGASRLRLNIQLCLRFDEGPAKPMPCGMLELSAPFSVDTSTDPDEAPSLSFLLQNLERVPPSHFGPHG